MGKTDKDAPARRKESKHSDWKRKRWEETLKDLKEEEKDLEEEGVQKALFGNE